MTHGQKIRWTYYIYLEYDMDGEGTYAQSTTPGSDNSPTGIGGPQSE